MMLRSFMTLTLWLCIHYAIQAQDSELKVKFGKISEEEQTMKSYEKDPDAAAVILFDKGLSTVSADYYIGFERHVRIKIFKKEAYDYANFEILYDKSFQNIDGLKAVCYNMENGKMVETKATSDNMHEEKLYKNRYVKKITIPNVREGSIIEYKYFILRGGIRDWSFQNEVPTVWSEYKMDIPEYFIISKVGQGATPYTVQSYNHWIQKDVPAIKPERYMTSIEDYRTKLFFYLEEIQVPGRPYVKVMKSWEETSKDLMKDEDFGSFIERKGVMKDEIEGIIKPTMSPLEKVQATYEYLGKTFEKFGAIQSIYVTDYVKELKNKKKVTPSEMNLIFLNMLNAEGISADPVLIRTRDKGKVATINAVLERYNRVIAHVKIDKDTFFVDASGYPQPLKLLPFNALSGHGVEFLGKEKYTVVTPQSKINNKRFMQSVLILDTEGTLSGNVNLTYSGYEAFDNRNRIKENGAEKFVQTAFKDLIADGKATDMKFENTETLSDLALKGSFKIKTTAYVNKTDDKIYITPSLNFSEKENPFKTDVRKFDVDFGTPKDEFFSLNLTIPEGYKVEEMPKVARIQMPENAMKFEYMIDTKGNTISINTKLTIKQTTYNSESYLFLKQLYAQMLSKMGEQIVLTKINK